MTNRRTRWSPLLLGFLRFISVLALFWVLTRYWFITVPVCAAVFAVTMYYVYVTGDRPTLRKERTHG